MKNAVIIDWLLQIRAIIIVSEKGKTISTTIIDKELRK